ncbi:MAG TPA: TMEM175 family protein [Micromonosporaceae bacterium]|nr:TMEM175 family protein [Micromonosporaceae bacterium]
MAGASGAGPAGAAGPGGNRRSGDLRSSWRSEGLQRLVFFSDAVIAIAMTLLAVELPIPDGASENALWDSFTSQLTREYLSFALSFAVIAAFWTSHHRFYEMVARLGRGMIWRNFVFLFLIVVMPFATNVMDETHGSKFGTVFYAATVCCVGLSRLEMLRHVRKVGCLRDDLTRQHTLNSIRVTTPVVAFGLSIPIALVDPVVARYSWIVLGVLVVVMERITRRLEDE